MELKDLLLKNQKERERRRSGRFFMFEEADEERERHQRARALVEWIAMTCMLASAAGCRKTAA